MANGSLTISANANQVRFPEGFVGDVQMDASRPIAVNKAIHLHKAGTKFDLAIGGTPATREEIVFTADAAGTITRFSCLLNENGTSTNIDFDLKVNGTTVLSAVVNQADSDSDKSVKSGSISSANIVAGDVVSISMAVTSATGAEGPYAWVTISEAAA